MEKYTKVDKATCIACGICGEIAPDIFDYDESGFSYSILDENEGVIPIPTEFEDDVDEAAEECPTGSIKTAERPFISRCMAK
nr:ferredoxin [Alteribacillus bidgolensis]